MTRVTLRQLAAQHARQRNQDGGTVGAVDYEAFGLAVCAALAEELEQQKQQLQVLSDPAITHGRKHQLAEIIASLWTLTKTPEELANLDDHGYAGHGDGMFDG